MDIIIASSRGKEMKKRLHKLHPNGRKLKVIAKSSLKLEDILDKLDSYMKTVKPHEMATCHVYLMAGLCDVTYRDYDEEFYRNTPYDEVIFNETPEEAFNRVSKTILELTNKIADKGATPIVATIVPSSLSSWNEIRLKQGKTAFLLHHAHYVSMQANMIRAIQLLNNYILGVNNVHYMYTPMLASTIMKNMSGPKPARVHYGMLEEDGVHPTEDLRDLWAARLMKAIHNNRERQRRRDQSQAPDYDKSDIRDISLEQDIWEALNREIEKD